MREKRLQFLKSKLLLKLLFIFFKIAKEHDKSEGEIGRKKKFFILIISNKNLEITLLEKHQN